MLICWPMNNDSPVLAERFWSKVHVTKRIRCWPWLGAKDSLGYGKLMHEMRPQRAHRVAFFLRNGSWPDNACHKCDNPSCCNPDHIFDGTRAANMKDMVAKGRHNTPRGERHGGAVLNDAKVREMRREYGLGCISLEGLASKAGCSFSTAQRVISRKNWRHV